MDSTWELEWECEQCTLVNDGQYHRCKLCYAARGTSSWATFTHDVSTLSIDADTSTKRRIVFLGRTGSGKSATGNNILGKKAFESSSCGSSVTKRCQRGTAFRFGRNIEIIDSPGLFDTDMTNADITREVVKCVAMTAPGPHAFVLVVRIDRFTKEEQDTVEHFLQVFGEDMLNYMVVLFTKKDYLIYDNTTLDQYLKDVPKELQRLLKACGDRCIAFNNRGSEAERNEDVQGLLDLVDAILRHNAGRYYTSEMFDEAEKKMKQREKQLKREHEKKAKQERDAIKKEYELKLKKKHRENNEMKKQMEERIKDLEMEKQNKKSTAEVSSLAKEVEELRSLIEDMRLEKARSDKELTKESEKKVIEIEKRHETEETDYREEAKDEVSQEKPGFMNFLGHVLPTLVGAVLPGVAGKVVGAVANFLRR